MGRDASWKPSKNCCVIEIGGIASAVVILADVYHALKSVAIHEERGEDACRLPAIRRRYADKSVRGSGGYLVAGDARFLTMEATASLSEFLIASCMPLLM
jgi:hypothetical protein